MKKNDHIDNKTIEHIREEITLRIQRRKLIRARAKFAVSAAIIVVSGFTLVPVGEWLSASFIHSGFFEYISLLTSDGADVFSTGSSWVMTLLDSLPILETTTIVGLLLLAAYGLRFAARSWQFISERQHTSPIRILS